MDHRARRAGPLRKGGDIISKRGVIELVKEEAEERSGLVTRVWLELGVDLDAERRGNSREQASLLL